MYPTDIIPEKKAETKKQKGVFRQNNFLNDPYVTKQLGDIKQDDVEGPSPGEELEVELTEEEFNYAVRMTDISIR